MTGASLIRLSGISAVLGGVLIILARVLQVGLFGASSLSQQSSSASFVPAVGFPGFAGGVLLLLGVVGLYARQFDRHITFGLISFVVAYFAGAMGWVLVAIHTFLAGKLPRWVPITMLVSMGLAAALPLGTIGPPAVLLNFLLAAGPLAFGYALWAQLERR